MAAETGNTGMFSGRRPLFIGIFVVLCLVLAAGYYLFLRADYAVLYTDMRPAEASSIVAELDAKGIPHRLQDNGTTILVPSDQADNVRLAVAGSDIPMKGSVGFELFNKSDMGLTDFAQKINYQRALQGELARTIMTMDGIEMARIHLAIPERSLFRGKQSTPKAAVEVITKSGQALTSDRVAGIQQLIASAVSDLPLGAVTVLDGDGRIISQAPPSAAFDTPDVEEQAAAQNYYSARARAALTKAIPGLGFDVHTLALRDSAQIDGSESATDGEAPAASASSNAKRNFRLRVTIVTEVALNAEDQGIARDAVAAAIGLDEAEGDTLSFQVGPTMLAASTPVIVPTIVAKPPVQGVDLASATPRLGGWWIWGLIGLFGLIAITFIVRQLQPELSTAERNAFVARVKRQLGTLEGDDARI